MNLECICIRIKGPERFSEFWTLRLGALKTVPEEFGRSCKDWHAFSDEVWPSRGRNI
jgi:hypothetical protein